jgi:phosphoglycerate dehydrogenase-like enzyme
MKKLKLFVRFLLLSPQQLESLQALGVEVTKSLDPDVNAIFSDQFFVEANLDRFPKIQYMQLATSGLDLVPIDHPNLNEAVVSGSRGIFNQPMASYVLAHVLSIYQHHRFFAQTQKDQQWRPSRHQEELTDKKVAVIGLGQIGNQIAKTFSFFGAKVDAFNRSDVDSIYIQNRFPLEGLGEKLGHYDIVVVSLALTPETKGILNASILGSLSPQSIFVNVGRAELIDEHALVSLLQNKKIKHAILDTFAKEPLPKDHPLWTLDNVTITPHISFTSPKNLERMYQALYTNLQLYLQGERLINHFK